MTGHNYISYFQSQRHLLGMDCYSATLDTPGRHFQLYGLMLHNFQFIWQWVILMQSQPLRTGPWSDPGPPKYWTILQKGLGPVHQAQTAKTSSNLRWINFLDLLFFYNLEIIRSSKNKAPFNRLYFSPEIGIVIFADVLWTRKYLILQLS